MEIPLLVVKKFKQLACAGRAIWSSHITGKLRNIWEKTWHSVSHFSPARPHICMATSYTSFYYKNFAVRLPCKARLVSLSIGFVTVMEVYQLLQSHNLRMALGLEPQSSAFSLELMYLFTDFLFYFSLCQ